MSCLARMENYIYLEKSDVTVLHVQRRKENYVNDVMSHIAKDSKAKTAGGSTLSILAFSMLARPSIHV